MNEVEDFKLTATELHSQLWMRLQPYLEARLSVHRIKNDGNLSPDETAKLRGRIGEINHLLALGKPEIPAPMTGHGNE